MYEASMIGIDLAKNSFQVHGARSDGSVAFRRKLTRTKVLPFLAAYPPCVVAMEACAGAHHCGREIMEFGHEVKLIPPNYEKPYVPPGSFRKTLREALLSVSRSRNLLEYP